MFTMIHKAFSSMILFILIALFPVISVSAEGVWTNYDWHGVQCIAVDYNNVLWFGTSNGVYSFDGTNLRVFWEEDGLASNNVQTVFVGPDNIKWFGTSEGISTYDDNNRDAPAVWHTYTTADGLIENNVISIAFDKNNIAWVGTANGVSSFDGAVWKTYAVGLAGRYVRSIAVDADNVKWFATDGDGVFSFDGMVWKNYTDKDGLAHGIIRNLVTSVAVDADDIKWFGTGGGISSFDGITMKNYYVPDRVLDFSGKLEYYFIQTIAVDAENTKWFGMTDGVASFDGVTWKVYTTADGLAGNSVWGIAIDADGVKWFLTDGGTVCSYDDRTPTSVEKSEEVPKSINLRGNFPNPFNPTTTIEFSFGRESLATLAIYNLAGQKVRTLVNGRLTAGVHSVVWDGKNEAGLAVSSGVYFCRVTAGNLTSVSKMTLMR